MSEKPNPLMDAKPDGGASIYDHLVTRWPKVQNPPRLVAEVIALTGDRIVRQLDRACVALERLADGVVGKLGDGPAAD